MKYCFSFLMLAGGWIFLWLYLHPNEMKRSALSWGMPLVLGMALLFFWASVAWLVSDGDKKK
jgi:uncharacterized membrane protein